MKCNICHGDARFSFYCEDYRYDIKGRFLFFKCIRCDAYSLEKNNAKGYPNGKYYSYMQKSKTGLLDRFSLFLYKLFYSEKFNVLSILFLIFRPFTRGTRIVKGAKLLDVGCGSGAFLDKMKRLGLEVYGIEPGNIPKTTLTKYNIQNTIAQNSKFQETYFDVITMNHVIEHSKTPEKDIRKLKGYLKSKGLFIIAAPNTESLAFKLFKGYWAQADPPRHLTLFNTRTLAQLLVSNGLRVKRIRYNSMPFQFASSLKYYLKSKGINARFLDFKFITYPLIPFAFLMNLLHIGDMVEIWAEKN